MLTYYLAFLLHALSFPTICSTTTMNDDTTAVPRNSTLVPFILDQHCDVVPNWMNDPVFLDPSSTLYLAVFTVLAYTIYRRLSGLVAKTAVALFRCCFDR